MSTDESVKKAFDKVFSDMYLSESETALGIFEYGYKAGVAIENEACAEIAYSMAYSEDEAVEIAKAIRARVK